MECILKNVRCSNIGNLWKPGKPPNSPADQEPKYGIHGIFEKGSEAYEVATKTFMAVAREVLGENAGRVVAAMEKDKKCVREGNKYLDKQGNVKNGYENRFYIVARNKGKPAVVDSFKRMDPKTGKPEWVNVDQGSGRIYAGCNVNMKVDMYYMDKPGMGRQLNATLLAVQYAGENDAFGAGPGSAEGFDAEVVEDGATLDASAGDPFGSAASDVDPFSSAPAKSVVQDYDPFAA